MQPNNYTSLREANRHQAIEEYERGITKLDSMPRMLFIELTQNCNLHCSMCRGVIKYDSQWDMPMDLFKRVADELFPYAEIVDLRGWGESTIMHQFMDYVEYALRFGCQYKLYTNLTKRDPAMWERLVEAGFVLAVSFDGAVPTTLEFLRGGSRFEIIEENLRLVVELCRKYHRPADSIYLSCLAQKRNLSEIIPLLEFTAKLGMTKLKLFPLMTHWDDPNHLHHYRDEIRSTLDNSFRRARELGVSLEIGATLHHDLVIETSTIDQCIHPWMYCLVDYCGRISYCDHLIGDAKYTLGDMTKMPFREIWNNELFLALREQHKLGNGCSFSGRFIDCTWCYKFRYTDYEHALYPPHLPRLVSSQQMTNGYIQLAPDTLMDSSNPIEFRAQDQDHNW